MRSSKFIVAAVGVLLVADCTIPIAGAAPSRETPPSAGKYGATESRIFDLINAQRQHQGLRPLVYNPQLDRMAKIQAENMARYQKMAHVIPDASLPTLGARAQYVGYIYGRLSENVALGCRGLDELQRSPPEYSGWRSDRDRDWYSSVDGRRVVLLPSIWPPA